MELSEEFGGCRGLKICGSGIKAKDLSHQAEEFKTIFNGHLSLVKGSKVFKVVIIIICNWPESIICHGNIDTIEIKFSLLLSPSG